MMSRRRMVVAVCSLVWFAGCAQLARMNTQPDSLEAWCAQSQSSGHTITPTLSGHEFAVVPVYYDHLLIQIADLLSGGSFDQKTGDLNATKVSEADITSRLCELLGIVISDRGGAVTWLSEPLSDKADLTAVTVEARRRGCTDVLFVRRPRMTLTRSIAGNSYREAALITTQASATTDAWHLALNTGDARYGNFVNFESSATGMRCPGCKEDLERQAEATRGIGRALLRAGAGLTARSSPEGESVDSVVSRAVRALAVTLVDRSS